MAKGSNWDLSYPTLTSHDLISLKRRLQETDPAFAASLSSTRNEAATMDNETSDTGDAVFDDDTALSATALADEIIKRRDITIDEHEENVEDTDIVADIASDDDWTYSGSESDKEDQGYTSPESEEDDFTEDASQYVAEEDNFIDETSQYVTEEGDFTEEMSQYSENIAATPPFSIFGDSGEENWPQSSSTIETNMYDEGDDQEDDFQDDE
jgi:hypothetical protein